MRSTAARHWLTRMAVCISAAGILSGASPVEANAADAKGNFVLRGMGAQTCQKYMDTVKANDAESKEYISWMEGYFTAVNKLTPETYDSLPIIAAGRTASIVYGVCLENPTIRLEAAVAAVGKMFEPYRVKNESRLIEVTTGDVTAAVREETMKWVQTSLHGQGLFAGKPDGLFSPELQKALIAYQGKKGIERSGAPDTATIINLMKDDQTQSQRR